MQACVKTAGGKLDREESRCRSSRHPESLAMVKGMGNVLKLSRYVISMYTWMTSERQLTVWWIESVLTGTSTTSFPSESAARPLLVDPPSLSRWT